MKIRLAGPAAFGGAALLVLVTSGCGEGTTGDGWTTRDSAGISVVHNATPAWEEGQGWRLSPEPLVDVGTLEGPAEGQLHRVQDAVRLSDGRLVVANGGTSELRFYDADGRHLRTVGGEGGGPGEFQGLAALIRYEGDSLLAWDARARRVSVYGPHGTFVRSLLLEGTEENPMPGFLGRLGDGSLLLRASRVLGAGVPGTGVHRDTQPLLLHAPDGTLRDTVALIRGPEVHVRSARGGFTIMHPLFAGTPRYAPTEDRLFVAPTEDPGIREFDLDGDLVRIIRKPHEPRPVTDELARRAAEERTAGIENDAMRREVRAGYEAMPRAETLPPYEALLVDPGGRLWAQRYTALREEPPVWDVFDREGRWLGPVRMPARFRAYQVGEDFLLGKWTDELDVERVQLYRIEKGPAG